MLYLSNMLGNPVYDSTGEKLGVVSDLAISTGEMFPRITSLAFKGPGRTPFMISWRKYVDSFSEDEVRLNTESYNIRFSYLQPDEVLLARDLLDQQIVDTQGLKLVRVNDLKLSPSGTQLRLLGAEVGVRGILRGLHPLLEKAVVNAAKLFGKKIDEKIIAWNYMGPARSRPVQGAAFRDAPPLERDAPCRRRRHSGAARPQAARRGVQAP